MQNYKNINFDYILNVINNNKGRIKIDSREIKPGDIFLTLKGNKEHGNNYIGDALAKKANYIISEKKLTKHRNKILQVKNCMEFLKYAANFKRSNYKGIIIGITGSVGKTSTKEQLNYFLSYKLRTYCSVKSYNNNLGVNLSLANLDLKSSVAIFEIGTSNFGEISELTKLLQPNIAIITNIGPTHLKCFNNTKNIAKEKSDIFNSKFNSKIKSVIIPNQGLHIKYILNKIKKDTLCKVLTFGNKNSANTYLKKVEKIDNQNFSINVSVSGQNLKYKISVNGIHQILNNLICLSVFNILNLDFNPFLQYASSLPKLSGRGKLYNLLFNNKKITLIDESYNASPMSMKATIEYFDKYINENQNKKILILGDMLELGKESVLFHKNISKYLNPSSFDLVITCGKLIKNLYNFYQNKKNMLFFEIDEKLYDYLKQNIKENDIILAKCSNNTLVNKFINKIKKC